MRWRKKDKVREPEPTPVAAPVPGPEEQAEQIIEAAEANTEQAEGKKLPPPPVGDGTPDPWVSKIAAGLTIGSVLWTGYGIWDLLDRQNAAILLALFADIGWLVFIRLEWRGVHLWRPWVLPALGWLIAIAVGGLLAVHGHREWGVPGLIAGPLLVVVTKLAWFGNMTLSKDPAEPTPEQRHQVHAIVRDSTHAAALGDAQRTARQRTHEDALAEKSMDLDLRLADMTAEQTIEKREEEHAHEIGRQRRLRALKDGEQFSAPPEHLAAALMQLMTGGTLPGGTPGTPPGTVGGSPVPPNPEERRSEDVPPPEGGGGTPLPDPRNPVGTPGGSPLPPVITIPAGATKTDAVLRAFAEGITGTSDVVKALASAGVEVTDRHVRNVKRSNPGPYL